MESESITCMKIGYKGDELPLLLLNAIISQINTCNSERLEKIPINLSESFLASLRNLWAQVHSQKFFRNFMKCDQGGLFSISHFKIEDLAESIFRLSISVCHIVSPFPFETIQGRLFGSNEPNFQDFMLKHWELSPFLFRSLSGASVEKDDIFVPFVQFLNATRSFPSFLSSILQNMISCIPIASDELDILTFLKEVRHKLGCPIIYQQDIRVLRTNKHSKREEHFFPFVSGSFFPKDSQIFNCNDVFKCEEAFKEGYTIALRGMEFRFRTIAAIADGLASMFGQPSVGANMYLTPPNSQGLACHYDDHCVFVCQLFGTKKWKVFSQSNLQLPRLYDPLDNLQFSEDDSSVAGCEPFSLREGDVLYIPRGFFHEAYTETGSMSAGYSLHLTLGIEVEPPFE
ncbi:JmjC domain containing protein [Trema orientale]|uniref:Bifunctional lysine-specific demethylase and histidyl-hydroxylase n=1 Tax=Trema orientale TaxID=63057 RepID=A0A2P5B1Q6_TREOI|nr:JmjC domain containing protein [Trema orientale]